MEWRRFAGMLMRPEVYEAEAEAEAKCYEAEVQCYEADANAEARVD